MFVHLKSMCICSMWVNNIFLLFINVVSKFLSAVLQIYQIVVLLLLQRYALLTLLPYGKKIIHYIPVLWFSIIFRFSSWHSPNNRYNTVSYLHHIVNQNPAFLLYQDRVKICVIRVAHYLMSTMSLLLTRKSSLYLKKLQDQSVNPKINVHYYCFRYVFIHVKVCDNKAESS